MSIVAAARAMVCMVVAALMQEILSHLELKECWRKHVPALLQFGYTAKSVVIYMAVHRPEGQPLSKGGG